MNRRCNFEVVWFPFDALGAGGPASAMMGNSAVYRCKENTHDKKAYALVPTWRRREGVKKVYLHVARMEVVVVAIMV